jgi:hypothetical protein
VETVAKKMKIKGREKKEEFGDLLFIHPHKMETVLKEELRKIFWITFKAFLYLP